MSKLSTNKKIIIFCILAIVAIVVMLFHKGETPEQRDRGVTTKVETRKTVDVTGGSISGDSLQESKIKKMGENRQKPTPTPKQDKKKQKDKSATKLGSGVKKEIKGTPKPVSTQIPKTREEKKEYCDFKITCQEVFSHTERLKDNVIQVIPQDGNIFSGKVEIKKGETVFDILKRICTEKNIALDYQYTPAYKTYYVKGIHNLYEFDCGEESGWMYQVNEIAPNVGCSSYKVKAGDHITFYYTCEYQ